MTSPGIGYTCGKVRITMLRKKAAVAALAALAQEVRLDIVRALVRSGDTPISAGALAEAVGTSPSNLSFHLKELESAGLIQSERQSRSILYRINPENMDALMAFLRDHCCAK